MRIRSAVLAGVFTVAALAGGAGSAFACGDNKGGHHEVVKAGFEHEVEAKGFYYKNLGGPYGITEAAGFKYEQETEGYLVAKR
ncbi:MULTISPECIES: hypothetical protein [Streptomyces]|uniref:hypothetical protein n=1 Tax=Streptomyces TaxID=1883 RepID=UPI000CD52716|nr:MULTISPECIES: hypothetical protein [Streptomyces]